MEKIKKTDVALLELLTGIFLSGILFSLAGLVLLFFKELSLGKYLVSMWLGILVAGGFSVHMWKSLNKAFGCEESQASRMLATGYVVRYLLEAVFLLAVYYVGKGYILAAFLGLMGMKTGAYLQPFSHKILEKIYKKQGGK